MRNDSSIVFKMAVVSLILFLAFCCAVFLGLAKGSTPGGFDALWRLLTASDGADPTMEGIILKIRLPRVISSALVGAALSAGGLVFQALLRNTLAEPYILGVSGGAAIGAITGILFGFSRFPGVQLTAFTGSMVTLFLIFLIGAGKSMIIKDRLLLSGVMVNAFCSAMIMFLLSLVQDARLHNIMFWLMGDLSSSSLKEALILAGLLAPCFLIISRYANVMNILLLGNELALTMGVRVVQTTLVLLVATTFMVSATVSHCGLIGFVGLVIPHIFRMALGPDHRILLPASILGGGAYMVICDLLSRMLPSQGEMPVGVITAMIGAPIFIFLLRKSNP